MHSILSGKKFVSILLELVELISINTLIVNHTHFSYTWDIDQHIVSHSILKSGVCSIPKDNKLWAEVKLEPKYV